MSKLRNKIVAIAVSVTTIIWLAGGVFLIPAPVAYAQTAAELEKQITDLLAKIKLLQDQLAKLQGKPSPSACNFTRNLTVGVRGDDVKCLQQYLNGAGFQVAASGAGSPGSETTFFGSLTRAAVVKWQGANAAKVLTPLGLARGTGYWGPSSIAHYKSLAAAQPPPPGPPGPPPPVPPGTGVEVARCATQPAAGLHPDNAVRVPYTCFTLTASNDGDVTIDSLLVERQGPSTDATFSGVVLLDEDMTQIGLEKTLNSVHQSTLTEDFTVKAGKNLTMYIGANRTTGGTSGTKASFALVKVNTSANVKVSGNLPFSGTEHTMNVGALAIGTVTVDTGPSKSVATTTEDAGKTMIFTAVKVSAGSTEDVDFESIRFNQVGTIGTTDITDVEVKVDGKVFPHTISSDGKYYTAKFRSAASTGVAIPKGSNAEVTIGGTLSGGTNRTIKFDVYRMTDFGLRGKLYSFGISPTAGTGFTGSNPVYFASETTVGVATARISRDAAVVSGNIAINLADQPLGGFIVDIKGEPISVAKMVFRVNRVTQATGATARNADDVDQIKMIDKDGKILAGPTDGSGTTVTFSDTVVFPIGKSNVKLVGKLDTDWVNNEAITASTTPSSDWTTVTGQNTGETITPSPSSAVAGNNQTVKAAVVTISVAPTPVAQTVIAGVQGFTFATYQLDATQSGEDIRFISIPLEYNVGGGGTANNLTSCQLYDRTKSLTTGSNVVNPSAAASSTIVTFDGSGLVIPRGTLKILDMRCNVAAGASGTYQWGYDSSSSPSPTGLTSGQSATVTENDSPGQRMTLASSGSYTVVDDSTPGYRIVNAGATGVTLLRLKFAAQNEDVDIERVGFQLTDVASNTPVNLAVSTAKLYDEAAPTVEIGTAAFTANGDFATSSLLTGKFKVPKGGAKTLLVKGDIATIGVGLQMERSSDLLKVDYDGNAQGLNGGNYGTGGSSGSTISPTSSDTSVGGVRILQSYPQFSFIDLSNKVLEEGDNQKPLYRFSVKAVGNDVHIGKLTFNIASTTISGNTQGRNATTSKYTLTAYIDSGFSNEDTTAPGNATAAGVVNASNCYFSSLGDNPTTWGANGGNDVGLQGSGDIEIFPTTGCLSGTTTLKIRGGETRYFELRANIASVENTGSAQNSISVRLRGDAAWPTTQQKPGDSATATGDMFAFGIVSNGPPSTSAGVEGDSNDDFVWSPGSTSTSPTVFDFDYTNGYQVPGLPATDMAAVTLSSTN